MFDRVKFLISAHVSGVVATTVTSLHCCCKVDREVFAADDFVRFAVVKMNCRRMSSVCSGQRPRPLWVNIVGQCAMVNVRLFSVRRWRTEWCSDVDGGHSRQAHFTRHRLSSISKHACGHTHTHATETERMREAKCRERLMSSADPYLMNLQTTFSPFAGVVRDSTFCTVSTDEFRCRRFASSTTLWWSTHSSRTSHKFLAVILSFIIIPKLAEVQTWRHFITTRILMIQRLKFGSWVRLLVRC